MEWVHNGTCQSSCRAIQFHVSWQGCNSLNIVILSVCLSWLNRQMYGAEEYLRQDYRSKVKVTINAYSYFPMGYLLNLPLRHNNMHFHDYQDQGTCPDIQFVNHYTSTAFLSFTMFIYLRKTAGIENHISLSSTTMTCYRWLINVTMLGQRIALFSGQSIGQTLDFQVRSVINY